MTSPFCFAKNASSHFVVSTATGSSAKLDSLGGVAFCIIGLTNIPISSATLDLPFYYRVLQNLCNTQVQSVEVPAVFG